MVTAAACVGMLRCVISKFARTSPALACLCWPHSPAPSLSCLWRRISLHTHPTQHTSHMHPQKQQLQHQLAQEREAREKKVRNCVRVHPGQDVGLRTHKQAPNVVCLCPHGKP